MELSVSTPSRTLTTRDVGLESLSDLRFLHPLKYGKSCGTSIEECFPTRIRCAPVLNCWTEYVLLCNLRNLSTILSTSVIFIARVPFFELVWAVWFEWHFLTHLRVSVCFFGCFLKRISLFPVKPLYISCKSSSTNNHHCFPLSPCPGSIYPTCVQDLSATYLISEVKRTLLPRRFTV